MMPPALLRERRAQATLELAIVAPVMVVLALIVFNLMVFLAASARFDRVAPDIVIAHGVSPAGGDGAEGADATAQVEAALREAMGAYDVEIEVERSEGTSASGEGSLLTLVGALHTYRCVMHMKPWPGELSIAGVSLGPPAFLVHEREVVIDPWRPGVVM